MNSNKNHSKQTKHSNAYLKYAGMVMQLLVLLLVAAYFGNWLDEWMENSMAYMTALLVLLAVIGYLVKIYFELTTKA